VGFQVQVIAGFFEGCFSVVTCTGMRMMSSFAIVLAVGCTSPNPNDSGGGGGGGSGSGGGSSSGGGGSSTDGGSSSGGGGSSTDGGGSSGGGGSSTGWSFAVFGDCRPPSQNDTTGYPSQIIGGIFSGAQAKGAQLVVGTGDYMFANTQSAVDAQVSLFFQAQANFKGPVYHTMGNHECNGYTASNCPNGNETPNVQAFLAKFVPSGTTTPYYRVDIDTPMGKAKFLFVAANAWNSTQQSWLQQQLADPTMYTFVVRHEPPGETQAPGVGPSDSLFQSNPVTLALFGHTHEFKKVSTNQIISGNGGAPLGGFGSGSNYGYLLVQQQTDGNLLINEIDAASGNATESWKVTPQGKAAP